MNGILVGVLGTLVVLLLLGALARLAVRRRFRRHAFARRRRGWAVARLLRRIEATPAQEEVLLEGLDAVRAALRGARDGLLASREEVAAALAADRLDAAVLDAVWARQIERATAAKEAVSAALARFHAALEPRQRVLLGELVRAGPGHRGC